MINRVMLATTPAQQMARRIAELTRLIEICEEHGLGENYTRPYQVELQYLAAHEYALLDIH